MCQLSLAWLKTLTCFPTAWQGTPRLTVYFLLYSYKIFWKINYWGAIYFIIIFKNPTDVLFSGHALRSYVFL